jgi:hypothetical protein
MATQEATRPTSRQVLQERGASATRSLRELLHLPSDLNDLSVLSTALAEIATEEGRRNPQFASAVRKRYDELAELRGRPTRRAPRASKEPLPPLVAIRRDTTYRDVDPFKPPDPKFLTYVYGRNQLARALKEYTVDMLKLTAAAYEAKYPGTKPTNRGHREPLIAYIVEQSGKEETS